MGSILEALLSKYADTVIIIIAVCFLYMKVNFIAKAVYEISKDQKDHWKFHLCETNKKGE